MVFYGSPELSTKLDIFANVHATKLFLKQTSILLQMKSDLILDSIIQFSNSATMNLENCLRRSWNVIITYVIQKMICHFWMGFTNIAYLEWSQKNVLEGRCTKRLVLLLRVTDGQWSFQRQKPIIKPYEERQIIPGGACYWLENSS